MHIFYCSEMGDAKPEAQIEARLSHYGRHYFLRTELELKGRGIKCLGTCDRGQRYQVTMRAFKILCEQYSISTEMLLD